jgi:hypothetical protein
MSDCPADYPGEPLFNRYSPLQDATLAAGLRRLAERAGVPDTSAEVRHELYKGTGGPLAHMWALGLKDIQKPLRTRESAQDLSWLCLSPAATQDGGAPPQ